MKLHPQLALWLGLLVATAVPATTGESGHKLANSPPASRQPAALMQEKLLNRKDIRARLMAVPPGSGTITRRNDGRRQKSTTVDAPPALKRISSRIHTLHKQPASQRRAQPVQQLRASNRNPARFKIAMDASTGTVRNIRGAFPVSGKARPASALFSDFAKGFVEENRAVFNLDHAQQELRLIASWNDQLGQEHAKYQLMHKGLPVLNEQISVHGRGGDIYFVNARYGRPQLALAATISAESAVDSALLHRDSSTAQLQQPARAELVVALHKGSYRQAWQVQLLLKNMMRWEYLIDAAQGSVLRFQRTIHSELVSATGFDALGQRRNFTAWHENNQYFLLDPSTPRAEASYDPINVLNDFGDQLLADAHNREDFDELLLSSSASPDSGWDASAVSVHANTRLVYDYYLNTFGRDSMDDAGMNLISVIHFGNAYANAFWNGRAMVYGDGDNVDFSDLGACLDVAAHELTHGVIEFSANLVYRNQSGALNESFADILGVMVDRDDWLMGEDCVISGPRYLRSLAHPNSGLGFQPKHVSEYVFLPDTEAGDHGGVHINSGIPNRAAYLLAEGLSAEGLGNSIGRSRTEQIFYRALTTYLNSTSQFLDARNATLQAAEDLYGTGSDAVVAVTAAWDAVGVIEGGVLSGSGGATVVDNVAGEDVIVYYFPENGSLPGGDLESLQLYVQKIEEPFAGYDPALDFGPLNAIVAPAYTRPAPMTINGALLILYVGVDGNVYLTGPSGGVQQLTEGGGLYSIAAAHDGSWLALTFDDTYDNRIYLINILDDSQFSIELASPNYTTDENTTATALFADSLSFDYTGRKLIYDFASCLPAPGEDCDPLTAPLYWSIGVYDLVRNQFEFPFPSQSTSLDLGFPRFATNSNRYFAFDLVDYAQLDSTGIVESSIYIYDSLEQELEVVGVSNLSENSTEPSWGSPSFNGDDTVLVFQARDDGHNYGFRTPLDNYAWNHAETMLWNDFDVGLPVAHRNADRTISAQLGADSLHLDFGSMDTQQSTVLELSLTNNGNRDIQIIDVAVTGQYFTHNATNLAIAAGQNIAVSIAFTAGRSGGVISDVLSIDHDGDNDVLLINLAAIVVGADLQIEAEDDNGNGRVDWNEGVRIDQSLHISANDMQLLRMYFGALGRIPDLGGLDFWRGRVAQGTGFSRMGDEFFWSPEMQLQMDADGNGVVSDTEFIEHLYVNTLRRQPDSGGFNYWTERLAAGDSVGLVMAAFLNGDEYIDQTLAGIADFALDHNSAF